MSVSRVLWLASLRSCSLIRPKKKQIRTAGEDQGTTQVYFWPETERISPLCPQEGKRSFLNWIWWGWGVLPLRRGGHGGDLARGNESGGLDWRAAW
ncbi:MAG: hypothetical protein D3923_06895 [Candidatus Electrothrix sp. AR3]|nr:hypothetical protein [Candidatus Electrothrix sp. AR3]